MLNQLITWTTLSMSKSRVNRYVAFAFAFVFAFAIAFAFVFAFAFAFKKLYSYSKSVLLFDRMDPDQLVSA